MEMESQQVESQQVESPAGGNESFDSRHELIRLNTVAMALS